MSLGGNGVKDPRIATIIPPPMHMICVRRFFHNRNCCKETVPGSFFCWECLEFMYGKLDPEFEDFPSTIDDLVIMHCHELNNERMASYVREQIRNDPTFKDGKRINQLFRHRRKYDINPIDRSWIGLLCHPNYNADYFDYEFIARPRGILHSLHVDVLFTKLKLIILAIRTLAELYGRSLLDLMPRFIYPYHHKNAHESY